ncbi:MAG: restriction endonuclease [Hyphomonadaceae bacterium]|nr:restriction endonuclease [Hyphomonadaceae bacterium]
MTPNQVSKAIVRSVQRNDPPVLLFDLIVTEIEATISIDLPDAQEKASKILARVRQKLEDEIYSRNLQKRPCDFCFSNSDTPYVQGVDYVRPNESEAKKSAAAARAKLAIIQAQILALSAEEFERLMGIILSKMGLENVYVTKSSSDDGVDFIGCFNIGNNNTEILVAEHFSSELELIVVGQAKRYTTSKFKLSELRELIGSVQLLKSNISARVEELEWPIKIRVADPVLNLFVISNDVSDSGWRLAQRSGVRILDLKKLSILLADLGFDPDEKSLADHCSDWSSSSNTNSEE